MISIWNILKRRVVSLPCDTKRGILANARHIILEGLHYVLAGKPLEKFWVSVPAFCKEVTFVEDICNTDVVAIE